MSPRLYIRFLLAFLILNFLLSGCYLVYVDRPIFYYEYLFLPLLFIWIPNRLFQYVLVFLFLFIDLLISFSHFYFFDSFNYLVKLPSLFISSFTFLQIMYGIAGFIILALIVFLVRSSFVIKSDAIFGFYKKNILIISFVGFFVIYGVDVYNGSSFINFKPAANNHLNVGKSLFRELYKDARIYYKNYAPLEAITNYSDRSLQMPPSYALMSDSISNRALLIIVESWGLPGNKLIQTALLQSMEEKLGAKYKITFDSTLSIGGTSQAEARELLNKSGEGYYSVVQHEEPVHQGLVHEKLRQGYQVFSRQGFSGFHSNGFKFRTLIGFPDVKEYGFYHDSLKFPDVYFNHYKSVDDRMVIKQVIESINMLPRAFAYILTINTHLPFELPESEKKGLLYSELYKKVGKLFPTAESFDQYFLIVSQLEFLSNELAKTGIEKIVLVGDHPPPFLKSSERDVYSLKFVPSITLETLGQ